MKEINKEEFKEACKPVVEFLKKYGTPHSSVIVTQTDAKLVNGECTTRFEAR